MTASCNNGLWGPLDTWFKRLLTIIGLVLIVGGPFAAWAEHCARLQALKERVDALERLVEQKIAPMRDDVLVLRADVAAIRDDIAELKGR